MTPFTIATIVLTTAIILAIMAILKLIKEEREFNRGTPPLTKKEPEIVSCDTCKCLLNKEDAQFVESNYHSNTYYCQIHKRPFDFVIFDKYNSKKDMRFRYYKKQIEVNEHGEPIGYKKIK